MTNLFIWKDLGEIIWSELARVQDQISGVLKRLSCEHQQLVSRCGWYQAVDLNRKNIYKLWKYLNVNLTI